MTRVMLISADCHAGAQPEVYRDYVDPQYREAYDGWRKQVELEMARRASLFDTDFEANHEKEKAVATGGMEGSWDFERRLQELEADSIVGEVIFPDSMGGGVPFGAGLMQNSFEMPPELTLAGIRAHNRWLADLCNTHPGRHAGVALVSLDDVDVATVEIQRAKEAGLFGGILIPAGTGKNPLYHHPRYEPIWRTCEELDMPVHSHSGGGTPDYGELPASPAIFISEVAWFAHRAFTFLLWAGVFERYPRLKLVMTEQGCSWIIHTLKEFERQFDMPLFRYFSRDLKLRPKEYFARQCYLGASFLHPEECADRYQIGVDKLMWGSDYPHLEGTWPHTREKLRETFGEVPATETRVMLGETAAEVYGFDVEALAEVVERAGPSQEEIGQAT